MTLPKLYTELQPISHTLRYIAGPDLEPLVALRNSKSDQEYIETLRNQFMPKAPNLVQ